MKIRGCDWWKFRAGRIFGFDCGGWLQLGPVCFDYFRWNYAEYWFEFHVLNFCVLRLRFPVRSES
jgi:hypothetical protein